MDDKYTATEIVTRAAEVYKHLVDEDSRELYDIRLRYLIHQNKKNIRNDVIEFFQHKYENEKLETKESELDKAIKANDPVNNIIIFGSGIDGKYVFNLLQLTKYKDKNILFCDNDKSKWHKIIKCKPQTGGGYTISPQELIDNYRDNSFVIIGSKINKANIYKQLIDIGYPTERILYSQKNYRHLFGMDYIWRMPRVEFYKNSFDEFIVIGDEFDKRYIVNLLQQSIYKSLPIYFCKEDIENEEFLSKNIQIISIDEIIKNHCNALLLINLSENRNIKFCEKLVDRGYPKGKICDRLFESNIGLTYFDYFDANKHEIFVDAGCFNGNTSVDFSDWAIKGYDYIYAFEANPNSIKNCKETFERYNLKGEVINRGLWNERGILNFSGNLSSSSKISENGSEQIEVISIDEFLNGKPVTFIKMDIEGAEFKALLGAEKTIKKYRPRLAICVYHKAEDILELPTLLLDMNPDYKFVLRQYFYNFTDAVLYAY